MERFEMLGEYLAILILLLLALVLAGGIVLASSLLGRPRASQTNIEPYECGIDQANLPRRPFVVKFFMIAIIFLLFDVEVALLYPWAVIFRRMITDGTGRIFFLEGAVFIFILAIALVYIFRYGALEWDE